MANTLFRAAFCYGELVKFDSKIYGKGTGTIDSIILHESNIVTYILDILPGSTFGGPSPNLYAGFSEIELSRIKISPSQEQQLATFYIHSNFTINDDVCFEQEDNRGQGRITEITVDCELNHYFTIDLRNGELLFAINENEIKNAPGHVNKKEFIIKIRAIKY